MIEDQSMTEDESMAPSAEALYAPMMNAREEVKRAVNLQQQVAERNAASDPDGDLRSWPTARPATDTRPVRIGC